MMINDFFNGFKVPTKLYWDEGFEQILAVRRTLTDLYLQDWLEHGVTRWTWWLLLFIAIFPIFIWWKYTDRKRFLEISFFGLLVSIFSGLVDYLGVQLMWFAYPDRLIPTAANYFPIDYVLIPVIYMLIYQKYTAWKSFIGANILVAAFLSLIADPVMVWLNIYQPLFWQYYYGIPTFVLIVIAAKAITAAIVLRDQSCLSTDT